MNFRRVLVLLIIAGLDQRVYASIIEDTDVDWFQLRNHLLYSYAAYCTPNLMDWDCLWCQQVPSLPAVNVSLIFESDGVYGTFGYIGRTNESIIVSFRGTVTANNWLHDAEFREVPYPDQPGTWVHEGFWHAYERIVERPILQTIANLSAEFPTFPISVTGHSLGGALATLCAIDLKRVGYDNVSLFTFGSPRVGNYNFSVYVDQMIDEKYRVVNQYDVVPHLPQRELFYHHVAREVWFPNNYFEYIVCDNTGEDPNCSDSIWPYDYSREDHSQYFGFWTRPYC